MDPALPFAFCLSLLPAPSGSEAVASPALSPWTILTEYSITTTLGSVWSSYLSTAAPQSLEAAMKPPQLVHGTCRAPAQLRAQGVVALDPRSASARACDFGTRLELLCVRAALLATSELNSASSMAAWAAIPPLPPPPAVRTRSSAAGGPVHAHPPSPPGWLHPPEACHGAREPRQRGAV